MAQDDHHPLAVYRYRLTTVDAFLYEQLPGEWTGWQKASFVLPLIGIGGVAGLIEDWPGIWWWGTVGGLVLAWVIVGVAVRNWRIRRRAAARAAREGQTEVEEWGDHLTVRSDAGLRHLANDMIGKVIVTDSHVYILYHGSQIIMPLRAFESLEAMRVFGEAIDTRSRQAAP